MDSPGTDALLLGLAAGDPGAFARLYDGFARRLYRVALALVGRPEDAEDAVQDVFVSVVRSRLQLAQVDDLTAYLFASLRRAANRSLARRAREALPIESPGEVAADAGRPADDHPHSERLDRALGALPAQQREVIALKIDGELTFAEIARLTGTSIHTAASRYRYALEKLRASLEGLE
jgi:RNA polymerase sigma-70 factor, ECF subfamily